MTSVLWLAFGLSLGAAVLHAALGLTRPVDRTYLSFAFMMALLGPYLYYEWVLYRATTGAEAVVAFRSQITIAHCFFGGLLVFVPAYTKARVPRWQMAALWGGLALLFAINIIAPYGIWFSAEPELERLTFRGEPYTAVLAPPTVLQGVHTVYVLGLMVFTIRCAIDLIRRGERQRGLVLAIAISVSVAQHLVDVVRDAIGGSWPYFAEFAIVSWGLIMSIQLAIDFRTTRERLQETLSETEERAAQLAELVNASLHVRDKLNTPLQTLEIGLAMCKPRNRDDIETLAILRRDVMELATLGRNVERAAQEQCFIPTEELAK
ncbi:MAG TPA: hypothetical protein VFV99_19290 [Kofleriaceae bacterium]|nr:hypothetical protein [Kofleriaceae bacterium]